MKAIGAAGLATATGTAEANTSAAGTRRTRTLMDGTTQETTLYINEADTGTMTTFVVGGVHGDEEAGYLAAGDLQRRIPNSGTLLVLPRANVVAIQGGTREGPNGDLNRKFPLREPPTTELARAIWSVVTEFDPDLVVDLHESKARYTDGGIGQSVGFSPLRNLRGAAQLSIDEVNESIDDAEDHFHPRFLPSPTEYPTGVFVQRTAFELGVPSYIVETYEGLDVLSRVRWQKAFVERLLDYRLAEFDATPPRRVLTVDGSGAETGYAFDVSGTVTGTDSVDSDDSVGESHVDGLVETGFDSYVYTGSVTDFSVTDGDVDDISVYVDGEEKTVDELTPGSTTELRIRTTGGAVEYQLGVDEQFTDADSIEDDEWLFEDRAYGVVDGDADVYEYERDVEYLDVTDGDPTALELEVDGEPTEVEDLDEEPTHSLWVMGSGTLTGFQFSVSGTVAGTDTIESNDSVGENSAFGQVRGGDDLFRFTGEVLSFEVLSDSADDIDVLVDGEERTIDDLNPPAVHELEISGNGTETRFAVEVSDIVYRAADLEENDRVGVDRFEGTVVGGDDTYLYRGDVTAFDVVDGSFDDIDVAIDGEQQSLSDLNPGWAETRTLTVDDPWQRYDFASVYESPVVIAKPPSFVGHQPCHVRLRDRGTERFEARIEEWLYENGVHYDESVGSLVVESGTHALETGGVVEAGRTVANHTWTSVSFERSFGSRPVVFCQSETERGWQPIVTRLANVSTDGFDVRVQEEEAEGPHYVETVGYVAIEPGTGTLDGIPFEAGRAAFDESWDDLAFEREYADPVFLADIQSFEGPNTCELRYAELSETGVEVKVEEEESDDEETGHLDEVVGYLTFDA